MKLKLSSADGLLLITTFIWGWTFIIVKWSVATIDPYLFIFYRFFLALIVLCAIFHAKIRANWKTCLKPGTILGVLLGLTFFAQTLGLKYTTVSVSGFITGLNVVLVTVFTAIIQKRPPQKPVLWGIVAATVGLFLVTYKGSLAFQKGDLLTLVCAIICALHVVYTERFAKGISASVLTIIQFMTITVLSALAFLLFGQTRGPLFQFSSFQWLSILYCGLLATALAFLFQTKAQQKIHSFRAAILLAMEPLFAGIFAMGLRVDPFDWRVVIGGLLIIAGMILASWDSHQNIPSVSSIPSALN